MPNPKPVLQVVNCAKTLNLNPKLNTAVRQVVKSACKSIVCDLFVLIEGQVMWEAYASR